MGGESGRNEINWAEIVATICFKKDGKSPLVTNLPRPFANGCANAGGGGGGGG